MSTTICSFIPDTFLPASYPFSSAVSAFLMLFASIIPCSSAFDLERRAISETMERDNATPSDASAYQEDVPNAETVAALLEGDEMLRTGKGQNFQGTAKELFAMLDAEGEDDA